MPFFFWLDATALSISIVFAIALTLTVLGVAPRRKINRWFALFTLMEAGWATFALLYRLALWLEKGDPMFLNEMAALFLGLMGPFLLVFTVRYIGLSSRRLDLGALLGLGLIAILTYPLFHHQLMSAPRLEPNGSSTTDLTTLGLVIGGIPALYYVWSTILFWRERRRLTEPFMAFSVSILLIGFLVGGMLQVDLPVMSLTNTLSMVLLGYAVISQQIINPLRDRTIKLQQEVAEHQQVEETLRGSEERFRAIFDAVNDAIFAQDPASGAILDINQKMCEMYGYTREELLHLDIGAISLGKHPYTQKEALKRIKRAAKGTPQLFEWRAKDKSGHLFWVEMNMRLATVGGQEQLLVAVRNITERKHAEEEIRRRNTELAILNQIGQALSQLVEPAEMLELIFNMIGQAVDNRNLFIALYDEATQQITFPIYTINGQRHEATSRAFGDGLTEHVLRTKTPLLIPANLDAITEELGISVIGTKSRCFLAAPMLIGDNAIGVIAIQDYENENVYKDNHVELLMTIASQAAGALENARLYQHAQQEIAERERAEEVLQRRATQLAILSLVGEQIVSELDLDDVLARAVNLIHDNFGYHHVAIFITDHEQDKTVMKTMAGSFVNLFPSGHSLRLGQGMVGWVAQEGRRLLANDVHTEPRYVSLSSEIIPTRSELSVPIRVGQEIVGVLDAQSPQLDAFDHNDVMVLETLAGQIAAAIENARLYGSVQQELAERKRAEQALQKYREHLEELVEQRTAELRSTNEQLIVLSKIKDEFVSNVSHELRTPIASLKLYAYLMDRRPEKRETYIASLKRETNRLEKLIEGVLMLSRLDQHRVNVNPEPFNLNDLAQEYVIDRTPLAESNQLTLTLDAMPDLPPVKADQQLLGEVLSILLTNAFNYTPAGGKVIISTSTASDSGKQWLGFSVIDSGPGIPPGEHKHMFERFYRGKVARDSGTPGTGLGLAIAREIVELHEGRIEVYSEGEPGHGAKFSVWLPG